MKNYRVLWGSAMDLLVGARNTPNYTSAWENYRKLFEEMALNADRLVEISRDGMDDVFCEHELYHFESPEWDEVMDRFAEEIEILRRVNYPWVNDWERDYNKYAAWRSAHAA